jgi:WbqC-like protein family
MVEKSSGKTVAILQSNYIPWKGYFDIIAGVDEFLIFDEAQFTRRDWRNRNKIVSDGVVRWLTIPVKSKGQFESPINEIEVSEPDWAEKHWRSLKHAYAKAAFFKTYAPMLEAAYSEAGKLERLSEINLLFLTRIADVLGVTTPFADTATVPHKAATPTARLVEICTGRNATVYVSGPAAKSYIDRSLFEEAGVGLRYVSYAGYPDYDQNSPTFEHGVSMLDVLLRFGPAARDHLKSVHDRERLLEPV